MTKQLLAKELRERQYRAGVVSRSLIDSLSDDGIIDSYITCSCCGERWVNELELIQAINTAKDSEHFFAITDRFSLLKSHKIQN